jgi:hypothetical protein
MSSKRCFRCLSLLPMSSFYKHAQMGDGHLNKCKECTKSDVNQNRLERINYYRQYDQMRASAPHRVAARKEYSLTSEGKAAHRRAALKWMQKHPDRRKASHAVNNAIRDRRLQRQLCWVCGEKAEAHHPDYSRPLDVVWLCRFHHYHAHKIAA